MNNLPACLTQTRCRGNLSLCLASYSLPPTQHCAGARLGTRLNSLSFQKDIIVTVMGSRLTFPLPAIHVFGGTLLHRVSSFLDGPPPAAMQAAGVLPSTHTVPGTRLGNAICLNLTIYFSTWLPLDRQKYFEVSIPTMPSPSVCSL